MIVLQDAHSELLALDVSHDVLSISTPGSQIRLGNKAYSVGLARLLNEVGDSEWSKKNPRELIILTEKVGSSGM